ncbi:TonB-dependent receptor [Massilia pseudoviolaceinigra]|uniref:TonB-dependent receptor n=1 Tax=Massilia pseudoviolaceinigra TaxID=3057165 RepID=UPI002796A332|nr:TonB-dependent receptor [Massilia sp. CCM 9206]MDQ1920271.1 TonB-dependent receptor [Massilia sp. CCM 9206]
MTLLSPLSRAVALACLLMANTDALAQQGAGAEAAPSSTVVVTATRGAKAVDKIPGAISVIGQQELASQYLIADDPSQALATYVPGYAPSRQKMTSTGESLRGRQPLILLDGIPQSNPLRAGSREGYFADSAIIERIEVINGASAMQGMGATGGIINYITRTARADGTTHGLNVRASSQLRSDNLDWKTGYSVTHKDGRFDLLGYVGLQRRGMGYDGDGRRLGIDNVQGDTLDSRGDDLFLKIGQRFGAQRIQLSLNRFNLRGEGDYKNEPGVVAAGVTTTSLPGRAPGEPPRNKVRSASLDYRHDELFGGAFSAQLFSHDFEALYGATPVATFQDVRLAPSGTLWDQSQIVADKRGARMTWVRPDMLADGLEMTVGLDLLHDNTLQRLAATNRTWVPQLQFRSTAPFAQLEYEIGPVTLRGGVRHEQARLTVDTYTTLAAYGSRLVEGGETEFSKSIKNIGAVWRFAPRWSAFAASSEGFGLPDVGLVLRGVNTNGKSVATLIDLKPIITRNNEVGVNWRGADGQVGLSRYDSRSKLGSVLRVNAAGIGSVERVPTVVKGWEVSGDWRPVKTVSVFGSYAVTDGKTAASQGAPLDLALSARSQGPDKGVLGANWQFAPKAQLRVQASHLRDRDINIGRKVGTSNLEEHFKGYTLADMAVTFESGYGRIGVSVENVLDKQYVGYYSQSAAALDATGTFAGRGRTLALSWNRTW